MRFAHAISLLLLVAAAGCGEDQPDLPTAPSVDVTIPITEVFEGTITAGSSRFYSFRVQADRNVTLMFASVTDADGRPVEVPMTLGFGIPQGTGCAVSRTTSTVPGLQAQIDHGTTAGTYCVNLMAPASLAGTAAFAVRIRQEPSELPDEAPGTVTFASLLAPGGFSSRTFTASRRGTVNVTLESVGQAARVGLAVGLPPLTGTGCRATRFVEATAGAGPQISLPVDIGTFCVSITDLGLLPAATTFSIRLQHP